MNRINVIGTSGSGKSTVAKKIAKKLSIPYVEMDRIFWGPNWSCPSDEEFFTNLKNEISSDKWVLDGNYTRTIPIKWKKAQLIVWVDLPFKNTLYQAVTRAYKRAKSKDEIWPGTGNRESFRKSFFSRDSIILWSIKNYKKVKIKYELCMKDEQYSHVEFVRLRSHQEINDFIDSFDVKN